MLNDSIVPPHFYRKDSSHRKMAMKMGSREVTSNLSSQPISIRDLPKRPLQSLNPPDDGFPLYFNANVPTHWQPGANSANCANCLRRQPNMLSHALWNTLRLLHSSNPQWNEVSFLNFTSKTLFDEGKRPMQTVDFHINTVSLQRRIRWKAKIGAK